MNNLLVVFGFLPNLTSKTDLYYTSPITRMCLICVGVESDEEVGPVDETSSLGMLSEQLNIFMALKELVDHSNTTPSREPDANRLAGIEERGRRRRRLTRRREGRGRGEEVDKEEGEERRLTRRREKKRRGGGGDGQTGKEEHECRVDFY